VTVAKPVRPDRLKLPDELAGNFTGLIIGTFGAALDFAEAHLFRQLSKSTLSRVVLADERQLGGFLGRQPSLRRLNRAYVACAVRSPHAHHPKYILLVGPDQGRLFVGSGNLSISGYAGPGECFTVHEWHREDPAADASAFGAVRELVEGTIVKGWIDQVAADRIRDIFSAARWIPTVGGPSSPVVHNLYRPLLEQLVERVNGKTVTHIVAAAPFHDKSGQAIAKLLGALEPAQFRLLVQERRTRLDVRALDRVLRRQPGAAIVEAAAPAPYPNTLLHAKFILVKTPDADVLLQGSANLSRIALCESGPDANVEAANLLTGEPGEFDHLLDALELRPRSDGLGSFIPDDDWGDDADDEPLPPGPINVCWAPPTLSGRVTATLKPTIEVRVGGTALAPARSQWEAAEGGRHFSLDFDDATSARIDSARTIDLVDSAGTVWTIYPYHLHSLMRLSASGSRADLLQEAGDLDLRDKELEELVSELERVLIVDGRSLWRLAHPDAPGHEAGPDADAPTLKYTDLDWDRIGNLPQLKQYGTAANRALLAPTELGIVLHSLTARFRAEVRAGSGEANDGAPDDSDDLGIEQEAEDADQLDEAEGGRETSDDEADTRRRIAPRQRVRRLWRNFVRRFVDGLADDEFVRTVGSPVIVPSYVVFNHLCRRLRVIDLVDADFLTDAQIRLWSFMWGDETRAGYVEALPVDEHAVARKILADHDDLAATLAAIDDAWWHVWAEGHDPVPLRDVWRSYLGAPSWRPEPRVLERAAAVTMRCEGDIDRLFTDLYELAGHFDVSEVQREVGRCLSISSSQLQTRRDSVMRAGERYNCTYFRANGALLTPSSAQTAIATWKAFESDRRYFRLEADNGIAVVDLDNNEGFFYERTSGDESPLDVGARPIPTWEQRLGLLVEAA
jgi:hypothetical protein